MQNVSGAVTRESPFLHRAEVKQLYSGNYLSTTYSVASGLCEHKLLVITHVRKSQRYTNFIGNCSSANVKMI